MKTSLKFAAYFAALLAGLVPSLHAQTRSVTADGNGTITWPAGNLTAPGNLTAGNVTSNGTITGATLAGNLSAANLTGTVADARLSGNVVTTTASDTTMAGNLTAASLTSNGTITGATLAGNLSAANLTGTVADARLSGNVVTTTAANTTMAGNLTAAKLTSNGTITGVTLAGNLSAANLTGTVADARLSGNVVTKSTYVANNFPTAVAPEFVYISEPDQPPGYAESYAMMQPRVSGSGMGDGSSTLQSGTYWEVPRIADIYDSEYAARQVTAAFWSFSPYSAYYIIGHGNSTGGEGLPGNQSDGAYSYVEPIAVFSCDTSMARTIDLFGATTVYANLSCTGNITAAKLTSNGTITGVTLVGNLSASNLTGTVADARLSGNVVRTSANSTGNIVTSGVFTSTNSTATNTFYGNVTALGNISASGNITTPVGIFGSTATLTGNLSAQHFLQNGIVDYRTENFIAGSNGLNGWVASNSNGSANTTPTITSGMEYGLLNCLCGTTAAVSRGGLNSNSLAQIALHPNFNTLFSVKVAPSTALYNNSTDTGTLFLGLGTVVSTAADSTAIEFRATNGGNWTTFVGNGTSNTTVDTGIAQVLGTYNVFSFVVSGNSSVTFYTTNQTTGTSTAINTVSTGLPTANLGWRMITYKGSSTALNAGFTLDWATTGRRGNIPVHPNF
jgi:hypothetical protein